MTPGAVGPLQPLTDLDSGIHIQVRSSIHIASPKNFVVPPLSRPCGCCCRWTVVIFPRSGCTAGNLLTLRPFYGPVLYPPLPVPACGLTGMLPCRAVLGATVMRHLCGNSYPHEAEWPGDKLETDLPASELGSLLEEVARPYTVSESREEGSNAPNVSDGK